MTREEPLELRIYASRSLADNSADHHYGFYLAKRGTPPLSGRFLVEKLEIPRQWRNELEKHASE